MLSCLKMATVKNDILPFLVVADDTPEQFIHKLIADVRDNIIVLVTY